MPETETPDDMIATDPLEVYNLAHAEYTEHRAAKSSAGASIGDEPDMRPRSPCRRASAATLG